METGSRLKPDTALRLARASGFAEAGIVPLPHPDEIRDADRFEQWVRAGHAGTMNYLSAHK